MSFFGFWHGLEQNQGKRGGSRGGGGPLLQVPCYGLRLYGAREGPEAFMAAFQDLRIKGKDKQGQGKAWHQSYLMLRGVRTIKSSFE